MANNCMFCVPHSMVREISEKIPMDETRRLPVEALREIFSYLPMFSKNEAEIADPCDVVIPSGLSLTHVCQRWRTVATTFPQLWTVIPLYNYQLATQALRLSQNATITVDIDLSRVLRDSLYCLTAALTLGQMARIRDLSMVFKHKQDIESAADLHEDVQQLIKILVAHSAPALESFCFHDSEQWNNKLPHNLFRGQDLPNLRHVEIRNGTFHPTSNLFRSPLTHLSILGSEFHTVPKTGIVDGGDPDEDIDDGSPPTFYSREAYLDMLHGLSHSLRTLNLRDSWMLFLRGSDALKYSTHSILFPHLEHFELGYTRRESLDAVELLRYVRLPPTVDLTVHLSTFIRDARPRLLSSVSGHFNQHAATPSFDTLDIVFTDYSAIPNTAVWTFTASQSSTGSSSPSGRFIWSTLTYMHNEALIHSMLSVIPMVQQIKTLSFPRRMTHTPANWLALCREVPEVNKIYVEGPSTLSFLLALERASYTGAPLLPSLRDITFSYVDFKGSPKPDGTSWWRFFRAHGHSGVAPKITVTVCDCRVTALDVLEFRTLSTRFKNCQVDWDGRFNGLPGAFRRNMAAPMRPTALVQRYISIPPS